jgi:hypothetical protein
MCNSNLHKPSIWEALLTVKMDYTIYLNSALLKHKTFIRYTVKYHSKTGLNFSTKSQ